MRDVIDSFTRLPAFKAAHYPCSRAYTICVFSLFAHAGHEVWHRGLHSIADLNCLHNCLMRQLRQRPAVDVYMCQSSCSKVYLHQPRCCRGSSVMPTCAESIGLIQLLMHTILKLHAQDTLNLEFGHGGKCILPIDCRDMRPLPAAVRAAYRELITWLTCPWLLSTKHFLSSCRPHQRVSAYL